MIQTINKEAKGLELVSDKKETDTLKFNTVDLDLFDTQVLYTNEKLKKGFRDDLSKFYLSKPAKVVVAKLISSLQASLKEKLIVIDEALTKSFGSKPTINAQIEKYEYYKDLHKEITIETGKLGGMKPETRKKYFDVVRGNAELKDILEFGNLIPENIIKEIEEAQKVELYFISYNLKNKINTDYLEGAGFKVSHLVLFDF